MENQRFLTIVAQDPTVRTAAGILTARIPVPGENLAPGPRGARVHVVDYDGGGKRFYLPPADWPVDPAGGGDLVRQPAFHAQNVYAIVMLVLTHFERALGRRVAWAFPSHQLKIVPHAFPCANAFYSRAHEALLFGYVRRPGDQPVFTCLAFDIVAHEAVHAILDGLRRSYSDPSGPDQAAFHEGFSDIVSLLAVLSLPEVVAQTLEGDRKTHRWRLRGTRLLRLAKELAQVVGEAGGRRPASLPPDPEWLNSTAYQAPHRRGEVLAAALLSAFLDVWEERSLLHGPGLSLPAARVAEEAAAIATALLAVTIKALDYLPPTDVRFGDFASAIATVPAVRLFAGSSLDAGQLAVRSLARYGIRPTSELPNAAWPIVEGSLSYRGLHLDSLQRDPEEVSAFLWANRTALALCPLADTRVQSVRPSLRIWPDGFAARETVAEYLRTLVIPAGELDKLGAAILKSAGMPPGERVKLVGGGVLIFDEYGRLRHHVSNSLLDGDRQTQRLRAFWEARLSPTPDGRETLPRRRWLIA
jgi:hypothetical protein